MLRYIKNYVANSFNDREDRQYKDYKRFISMFNDVNKEVFFILGNHDVLLWIKRIKATYPIVIGRNLRISLS